MAKKDGQGLHLSNQINQAMDTTPIEEISINHGIGQPKAMQAEHLIITLPPNPSQTSPSPSHTPKLETLEIPIPYQNAQNPFNHKETSQIDTNPKATQSNCHGEPSSLSTTSRKSSNNLRPTTTSTGLSTSIMDGNGINGPCSIIQSANQRPRLNCDTSQHPVFGSTSSGGHETSYEQLPQPGLAKQHPTTPSSLSEPSTSTCNEKSL
ncbi:PREDICTED: uncharacterized protein LOC109243121 [Nicotiana attenuata]|uniref:uncharacterized protein LOC109243121 n=1 Tax=Nicotiana attenuata TaxID=49451 RepID=UPI000904AFE9|nr:PREDICTED: uncharacterized protein LOC109243121 [Nicotiana attenuata]